jgi:hypothetical protein
MVLTRASRSDPARVGQETADGHAVAQGDHIVGKSHFWRHFVGMVIAMMVGMAVLGLPFRAVLDWLGYTRDEAFVRFPEIVCVVMTFNMVVGMVVWMRFRGHGWRTTAEMSLAMCAATVIALSMFWLHIVSEDPLIGLMHVLMLPTMLAAMILRREEYAHAHR